MEFDGEREKCNNALQIFIKILKIKDLYEFIKNGKYTLFVPINIEYNKELVKNNILYHISEGKIQVDCHKQFVNTLAMKKLYINKNNISGITSECLKILKCMSKKKLYIYCISGVLTLTKNYVQDPLDSETIGKYKTNLVIPPAMPKTDILKDCKKSIDYYKIAIKQFDQQILPEEYPKTTVWSYGSINHPNTFNYPAFTIEAKKNRKVRVKWVNKLTNECGNYLTHLLPVDPTLHWANPSGGISGRDMRPDFSETPGPYIGPVPIVTHLHGAVNVGDESDGYPEAWFLPKADNINPEYTKVGTWYKTFRDKFETLRSINDPTDKWKHGSSTFQYPNQQRTTTLWYHDHTLGITRLNVYAGPAGFYLLRTCCQCDPEYKIQKELPRPSPKVGDPPGKKYYEIPIVIQDRTFNKDGSLFYPNNRAFFEGLSPQKLQIPFIGQDACNNQPSDVSPIWNPEFFGNTIVTNGKTWPKLKVEARRYRFRFLNGCNSRFLILKLTETDPSTLNPNTPTPTDLNFYQIGNDEGFLPEVVELSSLLIGPAERRDVIVDFTNKMGKIYYLANDGPDEPFGGGNPGIDFPISNSTTTRQVIKINVVPPTSKDCTTPPSKLKLPPIKPLPPADNTRQVSLNEIDSRSVFVKEIDDQIIRLDCDSDSPFGPIEALLGTLINKRPNIKLWSDSITENPRIGSTEIWEMYNFTADAHPIHLHEIAFEILNRQEYELNETGKAIPMGPLILPDPGEAGRKDTVISYPGQITRIKMSFEGPGLFVWHCHILEHEDNEMMRSYAIGPIPNLSNKC